MKAYVIAIAALTALVFASPARSQIGTRKFTPKGWNVVFFDETRYRGSRKTVKSSISSVDQKWRRVKSIIIVGQWELCTGENFTGDCWQLRSSVADLKVYGFPGPVRSIRPVVLKPRN